MSTKHNPDNLTDEQVETHLGWRLLDKDEITLHFTKFANGLKRWTRLGSGWSREDYGGAIETLTYRTKLTREELRAKRGLSPATKVDRSELTMEAFAAAHGLRLEVHDRGDDGSILKRFCARLIDVELREGKSLLSSPMGNGSTPAEAIADYARQISSGLLIIDAMAATRREIPVPELKAVKPFVMLAATLSCAISDALSAKGNKGYAAYRAALEAAQVALEAGKQVVIE